MPSNAISALAPSIFNASNGIQYLKLHTVKLYTFEMSDNSTSSNHQEPTLKLISVAPT